MAATRSSIRPRRVRGGGCCLRPRERPDNTWAHTRRAVSARLVAVSVRVVRQAADGRGEGKTALHSGAHPGWRPRSRLPAAARCWITPEAATPRSLLLLDRCGSGGARPLRGVARRLRVLRPGGVQSPPSRPTDPPCTNDSGKNE